MRSRDRGGNALLPEAWRKREQRVDDGDVSSTEFPFFEIIIFFRRNGVIYKVNKSK